LIDSKNAFFGQPGKHHPYRCQVLLDRCTSVSCTPHFVELHFGQKTTLSQSGVGLSQRAKAFAIKFPFDVKAILPIGVDVRLPATDAPHLRHRRYGLRISAVQLI
jgi:hypothetical protein